MAFSDSSPRHLIAIASFFLHADDDDPERAGGGVVALATVISGQGEEVTHRDYNEWILSPEGIPKRERLYNLLYERNVIRAEKNSLVIA